MLEMVDWSEDPEPRETSIGEREGWDLSLGATNHRRRIPVRDTKVEEGREQTRHFVLIFAPSPP